MFHKFLEENNENDYAKYFSNNYMQEPWCCYYVGSSDVLGVLPNNNCIESYHSFIKKNIISNKYGSITTVVNDGCFKIIIIK